MNNRLKAIIAVVLAICLIIPCHSYAFSREKHDSELRKVLFGDSPVQNTDVFDALNDAVALAIDQHNGDGQNTLNELRNIYKIRGIPDNISKFNVGHGSLHRNYTHRGWSYNYNNPQNNTTDEAHWTDIRKKIILKTVNQEFNFGLLSGSFGRYNEQCDAFCALIYYVHIIGDHISNDTFHKDYYEIPLVEGSEDFGIIEELLKYSPILFKHQIGKNPTYYKYIGDLRDLETKIDKIYYKRSDLENSEIYRQYHEYAEELMQCLDDDIPNLIKYEPFFQNVFYEGMAGKVKRVAIQ